MMIEKISISGFKSIKEFKDMPLGKLNILIGANGSGKSNFIKVFSLLNHIIDKRLQLFVGQEGGADKLLFFGQKTTNKIKIDVDFGWKLYSCTLYPGENDRLFFAEEKCTFKNGSGGIPAMGSGHSESLIHAHAKNPVARHVLETMKSWIVYHFHDTSSSAKVRKQCDINDNRSLRNDASNLAAFLYLLKEKHENNYRNIVNTMRMVAPFFEDFILEPSRLNPEMISLEWRHTGSDSYFNSHALSDGTLRFICLATLLLQPEPPSVILLDEPELGLHPFAIALLADMLQSAKEKTQIIVSIQSVAFLNQFEPEDIIVFERSDEQSVFRKFSKEEIKDWLEDYGLGDLWEKNIIGGRP
ncbi:MAG: AAA family ATPase [bacterium]